ncbi:MAG: UDP-N-acetylmuramoyl-tripeptide--D-alanyl-D-alanine ligase, partial [bacterium]|nr:UDP-N-acetylmuramoyl-tripeptide--D-alanyl-D-alanine ligase [bacterium]
MSWTYTLAELADAIDVAVDAGALDFSSVSTDTRTLRPGDLFVALSGDRFDGSQFVSGAFEKGACAAITTVPNEAGPCLVVDSPLAALQTFAAWHRSHHDLPLLALTGSCGKTTT